MKEMFLNCQRFSVRVSEDEIWLLMNFFNENFHLGSRVFHSSVKIYVVKIQLFSFFNVEKLGTPKKMSKNTNRLCAYVFDGEYC